MKVETLREAVDLAGRLKHVIVAMANREGMASCRGRC